MIDLMVDTCVFFKMIEFNNFVIENGEEKLGEYINHKIQRLNLRETELTEKFGEEFANLYKDYSFDEKLDLIKDFLNRKESRLLREIEKNEHLAKGEVFDYKDVNYDADGKKIEINHYKFNPHITEEKKARAKLIADKNRSEYNSMLKFEDVQKDINSYKLLKDAINDGIIFKQALEGKFKLHISYMAFKEAMNHTIPKSDDADWCTWPKEDMLALTKNCFTLVTIRENDRRMQGIIGTLAKSYREESVGVKEDKNMGEDKNSLGDWGDSKIAAIASLTGMLLVTNNGKDFIFDKSIGKDNTNIRNHINASNNHNRFATDSTIVTAEQLIADIFTLATRSSGLNLVEQESEQNGFDNEIIIG